jgi:archaemetzincin
MFNQKIIHIMNCILLIFLLLKMDNMLKAMGGESKPAMHVYIQPLGPMEKKYLDKAVEGIITLFVAEITILDSRPLPQEAYYKPNKRYRADKLLDFLGKIPIAGNFSKQHVIILGLTDVDISTTKGRFYDWGILGLSMLSGGPAVVSTFRMKGIKDENVTMDRLVKVINHELGHTFGISHCSGNGCLMQDARGTVKTVDNEKGGLCNKCREILFKKGVIN